MPEWLVRGLADIGLSTRQVWAALSAIKDWYPRETMPRSQTISARRSTLRGLPCEH